MHVAENQKLFFFAAFDSVYSTSPFQGNPRKNLAIFDNNICLQNSTFWMDTSVYATSRINGNGFLIGGSFSTYNSQIANQIARLDNNGIFDNSFALSSKLSCRRVNCIEMYHGKILLSTENGYLQGTPINTFCAFNEDGTIYSNTVNPNGDIHVIRVSGDQIYLGGNFFSVNSRPTSRIARLTGSPTGVAPSASELPYKLSSSSRWYTLEMARNRTSTSL